MSDRVITSMGAGPQQRLLALARRTIEPYARRHGYDLRLHSEAVDASRPAPWSKIKILRDLVERYELVVWLDADLVVVDARVDLASELEEGKLLYLVEHRGPGWQMPNTGVMMLRGGPETAAFLDAVWELQQYVNHRWWENAAVCELLGYQLDPPAPVQTTPMLVRTKLIPQSWNSIVSPEWSAIAAAAVQPARIRHFPGYSLRTRTALMLAATAEAKGRSVVHRVR
ncbi:MAG: hypothetical protein WB698_10985 [Solirubrobacteraceae bacterium]